MTAVLTSKFAKEMKNKDVQSEMHENVKFIQCQHGLF